MQVDNHGIAHAGTGVPPHDTRGFACSLVSLCPVDTIHNVHFKKYHSGAANDLKFTLVTCVCCALAISPADFCSILFNHQLIDPVDSLESKGLSNARVPSFTQSAEVLCEGP